MLHWGLVHKGVINFSVLTQKYNWKQGASKFYTFLRILLAKEATIQVEQTEPYEEIQKGPKFAKTF